MISFPISVSYTFATKINMLTDSKKQIDSINNYFDFIYVLTIERAKDRQEKIKKDLDGLQYAFFFGADKKDLDLKTLEQTNVYSSDLDKMQNRYSKAMNLGYVACSMGHKAIYEDIVKNGFKRVLILEDDVVFNLEGIKHFDQMTKELPSNWELLYFDYAKHEQTTVKSYIKIYTYHIQKMIGGIKWSHTMIKNLFPKNHSTYLKKSGYHYFTSAYALTQSAAKKLIDLQTPIQFPPDHVLAYAITNELINGFISTPKLFNQQNPTTSNEIRSYIHQ